jgi:hypothetical protein
MRDHNLKAVYIRLNDKLETETVEIDFNDVFQSTLPNNELYFSFESKFEPYQIYSHDDIQGIDLVVKDTNGVFLAPLEIKLTVIPDNATKDAPQKMGFRSRHSSCYHEIHRARDCQRGQRTPTRRP